jgi:ribosome biogenesis GTPase A
MNINWYPGHMSKTKREIAEDIKLVDVVLELLDARIPFSSQNPDIQDIIRSKKHIVLLNKSDLSENVYNKKWIEYFKLNNIIGLEIDANLGKGMKDILKEIEKIMTADMEKAVLRGIARKRIRVMIVGIPNVGKSSLINRLSSRKATIVGNKPGVTRQKQWIKIADNIEVLDTPGVLWPKFEDENVSLNLAYTGTIKDDLIDKSEVVYHLLGYLYENYKNNMFERYKLTDDELDNIIENSEEYEQDKIYELMKLIAKKRGAIVSGGNIDEEKTSGIILNDFRSGKLGRITLEKYGK